MANKITSNIHEALKKKYKEGDLIDESTLEELGVTGGPESSSAVMQDEKGQYIVNLEDDEYFCGSCEDILREEDYKETKE